MADKYCALSTELTPTSIEELNCSSLINYNNCVCLQNNVSVSEATWNLNALALVTGPAYIASSVHIMREYYYLEM